MAADAKVLDEDGETGAKRYRYIRTGADHYSLAFTYDCIAWSGDYWGESRIVVPDYDDEYWDPILHADL